MSLLVLLLLVCTTQALDSSSVSDGRRQRYYPSYSSEGDSTLIPDSWWLPDGLERDGYQEFIQSRQNKPSSFWDFQAQDQERDQQDPRKIIPLFPSIKKRPAKQPLIYEFKDSFKDKYDVSITNASLLVDILNDLLAVKVINDIGVHIRNSFLPVQILNPLLNVNISNTPLPVIIQDRPGDFNATLLTDLWKDLLSNITAILNGSALNVTVNNKDFNVTVQNEDFGVYLLNSSIPVDITNATLNVNITNTPLPVIVQRQPDDLNGTTAERLLSELVSNITAFKGVSSFNVTVDNKEFNVSISNVPLPVSIANQTLTVQFASNAAIDVALSNSSLPVEIMNGTLNVNITNTPLPVLVVRQPDDINGTLITGIFEDILSNISAIKSGSELNVTINNKDLNVTISNSSLLVEIANQTLTAQLTTDSQIGVYLLNSSIPVDITNATLNVNITNTPLPVLVQRQPDDLNGTTAERLLSELVSNMTAIQRGSPLNVVVSNATLNVTIQNTPLDVNIANETLKVEFAANSTMGVYLLNSSIPVDITNATLNVNITNTPLPVVIERQPGDINATLLYGLLGELLGNITALKNMSSTSGYTQVCPSQLGANGAASACRTIVYGTTSYCFCFVDSLQLNAAEAEKFCSSLAPNGALVSSTTFSSDFLLELARMMRIASVQGKDYLVTSGTSACSTMYTSGGTPSGALTTVSCTADNNFICEYPLN